VGLPALLAQLVEHLHGKEGVDGSSPSEGSAKAPHVGAFPFRRTCSSSNVRWMWSRFGASAFARATAPAREEASAPQTRYGCASRVRTPASAQLAAWSAVGVEPWISSTRHGTEARRRRNRRCVIFLFPDSQDQVDPSYDFSRDSSSLDRVRQRDDRYAHEAISPALYDGILLSKALVDGKGSKYTFAQRLSGGSACRAHLPRARDASTCRRRPDGSRHCRSALRDAQDR
jgi:hypothetical protein